MKTAAIISLGCPRNLLDSEVIAGSLKRAGFQISDAQKGVDVCVINTCGFVRSAREESIEKIIEASHLKEKGRIKFLVICGCLSQLYKKKLADQLPEADLVLGTSDFTKLPALLKTLGAGRCRSVVSNSPTYLYNDKSPRAILTPRHYAYVKISEGCSNCCSYCIISRLRGAHRSRSTESVITEVKSLGADGKLKEINVIGQDTTLFGVDRCGRAALPDLLKRLCRLENNVKWIRLLYTHPAHYTDGLIFTVRDERKICKYLDLPIQHISDKILRRMNRSVTRKEITALIEKLRKNIPGLVLRTSIIVGFPGETEKDFKELLSFVRETRFEKLGAFIYSREDGTKAARFKGQISEKIKQARYDELMKIQQGIASDINSSFLGKRVEVLIDEKCKDQKGVFLGRTQGDAPEIDGSVYVSGANIRAGEFYKVHITDTLEYDLVGEI